MSDHNFEIEFFGELGMENRTVKVSASENATDRDIRSAIAFLVSIMKNREPEHDK